MSIVDIILLICFIPALISGIRKGFISQVISIVSLIAGVWLSYEFSEPVGAWLSQYIEATESILKLISFIIIMIAVFAVLALVGKLLEGIINFVMLGWVNRLLGMIFSLAKCVLILGLAVLAFNSLNETFGFVKPEQLSGSVLYPIIKDIADSVFPYLKSFLTLN